MSNQNQQVKINNLNDLEEINERLYKRNIPSDNLQPNLSFRPTSTKYQIYPMNVTVETDPLNIINNNNFNINNGFYPGTDKPPFSGYSNNVNSESYLRNQFFALQKCPQASWAPDSTSELYNYNVDANIKPDNVLQQFPQLFKKESLGYFNPNPSNLMMGNNLFNNHTRNQLKDMQN